MAHSEQKRLQVVSTWLLTGNCELVAIACKLPAQTVRLWRTKPWWKELEGILREEENLQASASLKRIVDRSLTTVLDRLENGDWQYDPKTGELIRRPVLLRDAQKVAGEMIDRRALLTKLHETKVAAPSVEESLRLIAAEFAKIAQGVKNAVEPQELRPGVPELPLEAAAEEAQGEEEFCACQPGEDAWSCDLHGCGPQTGAICGRVECVFQSAGAETVEEPVVSQEQASETEVQ